MEKIATRTKILVWAVVGDKERIDFDLCDFSPDQVGALDRLIRADGEAAIRLTIEPEQKKLQIAALVSTVRLVSLSCRTKGQKIRIAGFKSPDERATALKRLSAADTPILLTIEEVQRSLFSGSDKASDDAGQAGDLAITQGSAELPSGPSWGDAECEVGPDGTILSPQVVTIKLSGVRNAEARIEWALVRDPKFGTAAKPCWYGVLYLRLGNRVLDDNPPRISNVGFVERAQMLGDLRRQAGEWFDTIPGDKPADRKRRELMRGQVLEFIDRRIEESGQDADASTDEEDQERDE
jgi:hypothetical protein